MTRSKKACTLFIGAFLFLISSANAFADASGKTASILFPELPVELNVLDTNEASSIILLQLLTQPLIRGSSDSPKGFEHVLTDAVIRSFDNKKLSLRLRKGVSFSSSEPIRLLDVSYSIERCRQTQPLLNGVEIYGKSTVFSESYSEIWIDIELPKDAQYQDFINSLGKCPILEYKNNVIFNERLGFGSNIIAAGEFNLWTYRPGKSYLLTRSTTYPDRTGVNELEIGIYKDSKHGLRMLQSGAADAIVNDDPSVNELASSDSTLEVLACFNRWLVRRKGFRFSCTNDFGVYGIGYVS